jgi:hypothetical protein
MLGVIYARQGNKALGRTAQGAPARDTSAGCCVISANGLILKVKPSGVRSAHSFALRSAGRAAHQDLARNARLP